ncbi:serine hydrolase [Streptomyces sp. NBC_00289]|uniref:D-alanyl-D-alanine carboxypeptidase family protein n=1 Tax=Streptomyces sp. NBC_00289 TaxID=2975703 RepID=UPI0032453CDB
MNLGLHIPTRRQNRIDSEQARTLLGDSTDTPQGKPLWVIVRRLRIATPLIVLLSIFFIFIQMARPLPAPFITMPPELHYTFEGNAPNLPWPEEGQAAVEVEGVGIMGVNGEQRPSPIASVAKTMTAYVVLQNHPLAGEAEGPMIEVDQQAEIESNADGESTAPIRKGQAFTEKQMLQLLLIPSANNAARLLARWDSLSERVFVKKMNAAAKALGMKDTIYTDPSGLKATTLSTAIDQLKLAKAVLQNEVFREIVDTTQVEISDQIATVYNNNGRALLEPGVNGVKTGSSTSAGGNLLWSADTIIDGRRHRIVGAVFAIHTGASVNAKLQRAITDSITLIRAAQDAAESASIIMKGDLVGYANDGFGHRVPLMATRDLKAVGWPGLEVKSRLESDGVPRSARAGTVVGMVRVGKGAGMVTAPIALQDAVSEPDLIAKLIHF